jgi:hypothetical protein
LLSLRQAPPARVHLLRSRILVLRRGCLPLYARDLLASSAEEPARASAVAQSINAR